MNWMQNNYKGKVLIYVQLAKLFNGNYLKLSAHQYFSCI